MATCNTGGAGKWKIIDACNACFEGKHVIIIPDRDDVGRQHAEDVGTQRVDIARTVSVVDLPDTDKDVTDLASHAARGSRMSSPRRPRTNSSRKATTASRHRIFATVPRCRKTTNCRRQHRLVARDHRHRAGPRPDVRRQPVSLPWRRNSLHRSVRHRQIVGTDPARHLVVDRTTGVRHRRVDRCEFSSSKRKTTLVIFMKW